MSDFIKQVKDLKVVVVKKPRTYIQWTNTEPGRDKTDCYERIDNLYLRYVNTNNKSSDVTKDNKFFYILEELYQKAITPTKLTAKQKREIKERQEAEKEYADTVTRFKNGLPKQNLLQGNFDESFDISKLKGLTIISDECISNLKALQLLKAIFNYKISSALMVTSGTIPNYDYIIDQCWYEFEWYNINLYTLTFKFHQKSRKGHHDFYDTSFRIRSLDIEHFIFKYTWDIVTVDKFIEDFS